MLYLSLSCQMSRKFAYCEAKRLANPRNNVTDINHSHEDIFRIKRAHSNADYHSKSYSKWRKKADKRLAGHFALVLCRICMQYCTSSD